MIDFYQSNENDRFLEKYIMQGKYISFFIWTIILFK